MSLLSLILCTRSGSVTYCPTPQVLSLRHLLALENVHFGAQPTGLAAAVYLAHSDDQHDTHRRGRRTVWCAFGVPPLIPFTAGNTAVDRLPSHSSSHERTQIRLAAFFSDLDAAMQRARVMSQGE